MTVAKVGDVVDWADVPDGALVRDEHGDFAMRLNGWGHYVATPSDIEGGGWESWEEMGAHHDAWPWLNAACATRSTIVSLGLTGQETAADLKRLAEVLEVREVIDRATSPRRHRPSGGGHDRTWTVYGTPLNIPVKETPDRFAARLHAAGWRKGQTAEDAARLLREAGER